MPKKYRASRPEPSAARSTRRDDTAPGRAAAAGPDVAAPGPPQHGLVVANHGLHIAVQATGGAVQHCTRRRGVAVVTGDRVVWQALPDGSGIITGCLARSSLLARPDRLGVAKPIAANIDRIFIVAAVIPPLDEQLLDRYLVGAETSGITPVIVVNKADLLDPQQRDDIDARLAIYRRIGYEALLTSSADGEHLRELAAHMHGHSSVLVGKSGVGKSSLINALLPDLDIRIAALSEATSHGRHTTTTTMLYELPGGGSIIDSPGTRDFTIGNIDPADLQRGFIEFRPLLGACKFNDCLHRAEHGCAVKHAVENGAIQRARYRSYLALINELVPA